MIPNGRYALTFNNGVTRFFKVNTPDKGKWKGFTFITLLVADGGHGIESLTEYKIQDKDKRDAVRQMIAADPETASKNFGHKIGACGVCGRVLTDNVSIAEGIGPVCKDKQGW
jgi:hypothetical protein